MKFIAIDSVLKEQASSKIFYDYTYEFVGRKLNDDSEKNFEELKKGYFSLHTFTEKAISFAFDYAEDEEGYIKSVDIHKFKDKYFGHGKPVLDELKLTKNDINAIRNCFESSVNYTLDDEYKALLDKLKNKTLPNGYRIKKCAAKGVELLDSNNNELLLSKDTIKKCLAISHSYIDILYSDLLYKDNPGLFNEEEIEPLLSVVSMQDYSNYHNLKRLLDQADYRQIIRESNSGYKSLIEAIKQGDPAKVKEYAKYSAIFEVGYGAKDIHPLILAVKEHPEYVETLLEAGSYANPTYRLDKPNNESSSALSIAYAKKDYRSLQLIANCYDPKKIEKDLMPKWGEDNTYASALRSFTIESYDRLYKNYDEKAAVILLPHTNGLVFDTAKIVPLLSVDHIRTLASFEGMRINWDRKYFEMVYPLDRQLCRKMLDQGCYADSINYFIDIDDYDLFKDGINKWIGPNDIFLKYDSYIKVFSKDPRWHKTIKEATWRVMDLDNRYLSELFETDRDAFDAVRIKYSLPTTNVVSLVKHLNQLLKEKRTKDFMEIVEKYDLQITHTILKGLVVYLESYDPAERAGTLSFIFDRYSKVYYSDDDGRYNYRTNISHEDAKDNYMEAIYKYGSCKMIERYIKKYLIEYTDEINDFINHFKVHYYAALKYCNSEASNLLLRMILDYLKRAENGDVTFRGPYSDHVSLPVSEIYRTIRNEYDSKYEWPPEEEKQVVRRRIVKDNMVYYLNNVNVRILLQKEALYEQSKDAATILHDVEHMGIEDVQLIEKIKKEAAPTAM